MTAIFLLFIYFQEFHVEIAEYNLRLEDAEKLSRRYSLITINIIISIPFLNATSVNVKARSLRSNIDTYLANTLLGEEKH